MSAAVSRSRSSLTFSGENLTGGRPSFLRPLDILGNFAEIPDHKGYYIDRYGHVTRGLPFTEEYEILPTPMRRRMGEMVAEIDGSEIFPRALVKEFFGVTRKPDQRPVQPLRKVGRIKTEKPKKPKVIRKRREKKCWCRTCDKEYGSMKALAEDHGWTVPSVRTRFYELAKDRIPFKGHTIERMSQS